MTNIKTLQDEVYIRRRLAPAPGDADYLHLSDILISLQKFATDEKILILDYGCGGSPYRKLFPNSNYRRADFDAMADLDYVIKPDGGIDERDESFDLILSTQVAEHTTDPVGYLAECYRLLRKGGRLICTTHGSYPDHGCPYDFQRWTVDGLKRDLEAAGFTVEKAEKLTTNGRGIMYLFQQFSGWFDTSHSIFWSILFRFLRSYLHRMPSFYQKTADRIFPENRVVADDVPGHEFYIALTILGLKEE
jgi:SAM-dependent methyltransferase